jgi:hypothetical protein
MGTEKKMLPHQQRVVDEANELREKFLKLDAFILDNPIYKELEKEEQKDLKLQRTYMELYLLTLERRISRF